MTQWVVDEHGLTGGDAYEIDADRLLNRRGSFYEWPIHLRNKTWIDFEDFWGAFERALKFHGKRYSKKRLAATLEECRRIKQRSDEYDAIARELFPEKFQPDSWGFWTVAEMSAVAEEQERRHANKRDAANDNSPAATAAGALACG